MGTKISALPVASSVGGTDLVPIVQGGTTMSATAALVRGGGASVTWANDLVSSTSTNQYVSSITGTSGTGTSVALGSAGVAFAMTFAAGVTAPSITQAINGSGAGVAMSITAQAAKVGSAAAGGGLTVGTGAGDGAGVAGTFDMATGGTARWRLQPNTTAGNTALVSVQTDPIEFGTGKMPSSGFGLIKFPNTTGTTTLLSQKDTPGGGTIDLPILSTDPNAYNIHIGAVTDATYLQKWSNINLRSATNINAKSPTVWVQCPSVTFYDIAGTIGLTLSVVPAGASSWAWAIGTTPTYKQADQTVASTNGVTTTVAAQNATGTTSTGGDLVIQPGTGTTANGKLNLNNVITTTTVGVAGAASAMPTPVGYLNIKVNGTAFRVAYFN